DTVIVLIAVAQNGSALRFASHELQAQHEVVKIAVAKTPTSIMYASKNLQLDSEMLMMLPYLIRLRHIDRIGAGALFREQESHGS
ncbi:DUF4116 domain-containing protein, partial [bacterium]|nr:DUF4116 domain-containing protein [bacterium]